MRKKSISAKDFYKKATSAKYKTPQMTDLEDVERKYWKNITFVAPIYGADVPGSITDKDCKVRCILIYILPLDVSIIAQEQHKGVLIVIL